MTAHQTRAVRSGRSRYPSSGQGRLAPSRPPSAAWLQSRSARSTFRRTRSSHSLQSQRRYRRFTGTPKLVDEFGDRRSRRRATAPEWRAHAWEYDGNKHTVTMSAKKSVLQGRTCPHTQPIRQAIRSSMCARRGLRRRQGGSHRAGARSSDLSNGSPTVRSGGAGFGHRSPNTCRSAPGPAGAIIRRVNERPASASQRGFVNVGFVGNCPTAAAPVVAFRVGPRSRLQSDVRPRAIPTRLEVPPPHSQLEEHDDGPALSQPRRREV